jgi:sugar phosphate isomerase/epimerase
MNDSKGLTMSDLRLSRRRFLGASAGGAAALALGPWTAPAAAGLSKGQISIQMWTLRDMFAADPEGTLRALAGIGYVQIELAGMPPGHTAASLRALLDDVGIRAYSGHDGWDTNNFDEGAYRAQLERAVTVGQRQTGFAWFPGPYTEDYFKVVAAQLNRAGAIAREYGLRFFYHNHDFEFTNLRADGRPVYTVLLEETDPALVKFQMDLMWIHFGGGPWRQLLTTMPDRFISFHVKDQSPEAAPGCGCDLFADPGQGVAPLQEMIATAGNARNRRYVVERDSQVHPLTTARIGYEFLRGLSI